MALTHDGREVDSSSEDWRLECEARYLLALGAHEAIAVELAAIEAKRGKGSIDELRRRVRQMGA